MFNIKTMVADERSIMLQLLRKSRELDRRFDHFSMQRLPVPVGIITALKQNIVDIKNCIIRFRGLNPESIDQINGNILAFANLMASENIDVVDWMHREIITED